MKSFESRIFYKQSAYGGDGSASTRESRIIDKRKNVLPLDTIASKVRANRQGKYDEGLTTTSSTRAEAEVTRAEKQYNG